MRCLACNTLNEPGGGASSCRRCGAALALLCQHCHYLNATTGRFCGGCGQALTPPPVVHGPAERRQITVVFCDLVSSSALAARSDPEIYWELLRTYQRRCAEVIGRYQGHVAQYLGDGLLIYFGYPTAQEDAAERSVRAAVALADATRELGESVRATRGLALEVRIGIHTGPVVVGAMGGGQRVEFLAVGETPNTAARVQAAAPPGGVVVSEATYRLVKGYFAFDELGEFELKGVAGRMQLYRVLGETLARTRVDASAQALTRFVGREQELGQLVSWWGEAQRGASPFVLISGEPGIGKSRHLRCLRESLDGDVLRLEGHCSPLLGASALHPLAQILQRRLDLAPKASAEERFERLVDELARVALSAPPAPALLADLLGISRPGAAAGELSPQKQRQLTFDALLAWLGALAERAPVLLVIEDVHWADPSTLEFLGALLERSFPGPLMTVLTHRPEFDAPWRSGRRRDIVLGRLSAPEAQALVAAVLRERCLPPVAIQQILEKADGVPLFIEEITQAVLESSLRDPVEHGGAGASALDIPATLQDSLASRVDRLGSSKAVLQLAATIGRLVPFELLLAVANTEEPTLRDELERLLDAGLLSRRGEPPREQLVFKHALIQEAAYASLLKSVRQDLHRRIAEVLASGAAADADAVEPEILAEHYARAGMHLPASEHYARAGQRALARSAFSEAIVSFTRALAALHALPRDVERDRREVELLAGLGLAQLSTRGFSSREVEETYGRAQVLCERFGDVPMRVLFGVWAVHIVRGDEDAAARLVPVFQNKIDRGEDDSTLLISHAALATRDFHLGRYEASQRHGFEGVARCDEDAPRAQFERLVREHGYEGLLYTHLYGAWALLHLGRVDAMERLLRGAHRVAERMELSYPRTMERAFAAACAMDADDPLRALEAAALARRLGSDNQFTYWLGLAQCLEGWAEARLERTSSGLGKIEQGLAILNGMGAAIVIPYYTGCLARVQLAAGLPEPALASVRRALAMPGSSVWVHCRSELVRIEGEALAALGQAAAAEDRLRAAWEEASREESRVWRVTTACSLARALAARGEREGARAALGSACEGFSEAVRLPLVVEARRLLERLA